jgi:hypothetical protein
VAPTSPTGAKPEEGQGTPAPAAQPGEGKTGEAKPPEAAPAPAPLTEKDFKIPDGIVVAPEVQTEFLGIMNNAELDPAKRAQALIDLQAKVARSASEKASKDWDDTQTMWRNEVQADPQVGGTKMQENLGQVSKIIDEFGSPELRHVFDLTGAGNNIHVVKFLLKMGAALNEGRQRQPGSPGSQPPQSQAQRIFGTGNKK